MQKDKNLRSGADTLGFISVPSRLHDKFAMKVRLKNFETVLSFQDNNEEPSMPPRRAGRPRKQVIHARSDH